MELAKAEDKLGVVFPDRHREAMRNAADPIHKACDFLIPASPHELLRLVEVNEFLHAGNRTERWPSFLIAFASNGCGDYFAYDLRSQPPRIIYVDPDHTIDENLAASDTLEFNSFDEWYADRLTARSRAHAR
jgi:hypothetical protein